MKFTKEQSSVSAYYNKQARKWFGINGNRNLVLHHKDETLRSHNIDRYILWLPDDLVVVTRSEHQKYHTQGEKNPRYGKGLCGALNGRFGEEVSANTRSLIGGANRNLYINNPTKREERSKIMKNNRNVNPDAYNKYKNILCYTKDGELVKVYTYAKDIKNDINIPNTSCIIIRCKTKNMRLFKGYIWRFQHPTDYLNVDVNDYFDFSKFDENEYKRRPQKDKTRVQKDGIRKNIKSEFLDDYIKNGWTLGWRQKEE